MPKKIQKSNSVEPVQKRKVVPKLATQKSYSKVIKPKWEHKPKPTKEKVEK